MLGDRGKTWVKPDTVFTQIKAYLIFKILTQREEADVINLSIYYWLEFKPWEREFDRTYS